MATIQIIDDQPVIRTLIRRLLGEGNSYIESGTGHDGIAEFDARRPDCVLCDVVMPDLNGLSVLKRIKELSPATPVVMVTGEGTTELAIRAMALGASDYLLKPLDTAHIRQIVGSILESLSLAGPPNPPTADSGSVEPLIGRSEPMYEVFKLIGRVAVQNTTVLITGETGTGKELVARAIHAHGTRRDEPFVPINCAAIPEALLESELFGHEKGAFTGADRLREGKFELARGGTLFFDEIGEMSVATQAKLLRVLQDQEFHRVGGSVPIRTTARIVAATNRDLRSEATAGRFRDDLFYRLGVVIIRLPPLRERAGDIPLLVDSLIRRFAAESGLGVRGISTAALDVLCGYGWPGNVRELSNVVQQAVLHSPGPVLLPSQFADLNSTAGRRTSDTPFLDAVSLAAHVRDLVARNESDILKALLAKYEKFIIDTVVGACDGNLSQASRHLGIHRITLKAKLTEAAAAVPDAPKTEE